MTSADDLTDEQRDVAAKIQKLLNLAAKAGTPAEAEAAASKAQQLLEKHNLDAAVVAGENDIKEGKREEALVDGGAYSFQREIWKSVAELNFCVYWNQKYRRDFKKKIWNPDGSLCYVNEGSTMRRRHALIGRIKNTRATIAMAGYLEQAIDRVLRSNLSDTGDNLTSNFAWSFRKGAAYEICRKLKERRADRIAEETELQKKAERAAKAAGQATTERGLTLASFSKSEKEANDDFRFGEGYSAKRAAEEAQDALDTAAMHQAYTLWAAANPKEARSKFRFEAPSGKIWVFGTNRGGGRSSRDDDGVDYSGFNAGRNAGKGIGLDAQTSDRKASQGRLR